MKKPEKHILEDWEEEKQFCPICGTDGCVFNDCHDLLTAYYEELLKEVLEVHEKYKVVYGGIGIVDEETELWSAIKNLAQRVKEEK